MNKVITCQYTTSLSLLLYTNHLAIFAYINFPWAPWMMLGLVSKTNKPSRMCSSLIRCLIQDSPRLGTGSFSSAQDTVKNGKSLPGAVAIVLDCDIIVSELNSSHAITFNFRLMPLGKAWTPLSPQYCSSTMMALVLYLPQRYHWKKKPNKPKQVIFSKLRHLSGPLQIMNRAGILDTRWKSNLLLNNRLAESSSFGGGAWSVVFWKDLNCYPKSGNY